MADRGEFLSQLQGQLIKWNEWAERLESEAADEEHLAQVRALVERAQALWDRVNEADESTWQDMQTSADQGWRVLLDSAASLNTDDRTQAEADRAPVARAVKPRRASRPAKRNVSEARPAADARAANEKSPSRKVRAKPTSAATAKSKTAKTKATKVKSGARKRVIRRQPVRKK